MTTIDIRTEEGFFTVLRRIPNWQILNREIRRLEKRWYETPTTAVVRLATGRKFPPTEVREAARFAGIPTPFANALISAEDLLSGYDPLLRTRLLREIRLAQSGQRSLPCDVHTRHLVQLKSVRRPKTPKGKRSG